MSHKRNHSFWKDYGNMILKSKSSLSFLSLYLLITVREIRNALERFAVELKDFSNSYVISLLKDLFYKFVVKVYMGSRLITLNVPV